MTGCALEVELVGSSYKGKVPKAKADLRLVGIAGMPRANGTLIGMRRYKQGIGEAHVSTETVQR